jgi:transcriptional regulator with XRE-family HTH domain
MDDGLRRLGVRIRELRTRRGWSQESFADIAGVHRTYMGHLERGEKNVSFLSIVRVANALGVTLSELLSGLENGGSARAANRTAATVRTAASSLALEEVAALERTVRKLKGLLGEIAPSSNRPERKRSPKIKDRNSL